MTKFSMAVIAALALSLGYNIWLIRRPIKDLQPHYYKSEQLYVDRAVALWAEHTKASPTRAMQSRYVQAIYAGKQVCVALLLKKGSVGANPAYCFLTETGQLILRYDDEE